MHAHAHCQLPRSLHPYAWCLFNVNKFRKSAVYQFQNFIIIEQNHAQKGNGKKREIAKNGGYKYLKALEWIVNEMRMKWCFMSFRLKDFDREKPHFLFEWQEGNWTARIRNTAEREKIVPFKKSRSVAKMCKHNASSSKQQLQYQK